MRQIIFFSACSVFAIKAGAVISHIDKHQQNNIPVNTYSNYNAVPPSFRAFMQNDNLEFSVLINGIYFSDIVADLKNNHIYIHMRDVSQLNLSKKESDQIVDALAAGLPLNKEGIIPAKVNGVVESFYIDFSSMKINIKLKSELLEKEKPVSLFFTRLNGQSVVVIISI